MRLHVLSMFGRDIGVVVRHIHFFRNWRAVVARIVRPRRQDRFLMRHLLVGHAGQEVGDAIETGALLERFPLRHIQMGILRG